jgi:hypothetical protein
MNLYSLNNLVNAIASKPKKTNRDCLYLNTLLNDAVSEGLNVELDRKTGFYIITGKERNYVFERSF